MRAQYSGRVAEFDDHRGRGEIEARGGLRFPFHCTAIADGSRTIAEGAPVQFRLVIG
jgi:cold shock CspA family protein